METQNAVEDNISGKITDDNTDGNQNNCKDVENEHQTISEKEPVDNGDDDIDPLDLIANCNEIGGDLISDNSDVWKCSDTDEESYSNQKDIDNQLIDNTEMDLIDDNINEKELQQSNNNDNILETTNCINENKNDNGADIPVESSDKTIEALIDSPDKTTDTPIDIPDKTTDTPVDSPDKMTGALIDSPDKSTDTPIDSPDKTTDTPIESPDKTTDAPIDSPDKTADTPIDSSDKMIDAPIDSPDKTTDTSIDSPVNTDKTIDDLQEKQLNNNNTNDNETLKDKIVIINDRKGDDSGDSGISDTVTTQDKTDIIDDNDTNFEEKMNEDNDNDEMDYSDLDPSLLCPEVSMAIEESSVITETTTNNDSTSPLPYEPLYSTYVDEITGAEISFNLTPEEHDLRTKRYTSANPVEYTKIHCTACNQHLGSALEAQNNRFVHPLLKVLICKKCYNFYTSGEFEKDEDGSELYCRWCGQGGQVLCCSKCECVFCKKCIKTNFGRRKLNEIKESDDWVCFKCNPAQLTNQRIACFELFEYVRRESARAATLNDPEFLSTDHSLCCKPPQQTDLVDVNKEKKRPKKKKSDDPEYDPLEENQPAVKKIKVIFPKQTVPLTNNNNNNDNNNTTITNNNNNTLITPITAAILQPSQILQPTILQTTSSPRPLTIHRPQIIGNQRTWPTTPTLVRINSTNQLTTLTPTIVTTTQTAVPPLVYRNAPDLSKHEWFERTVRSTARVNSHLSYTLTTLNKAQAQAGSLEELANVHNKLQEVLSSSINSLIQIRKNLRNEFIAGIKKTHLPARKIDPSTNKDDDDVIFVSAAPATLKISKPVLLKRDTNLPTTINIISNNNTNISSSSSSSSNNNNNNMSILNSVLSTSEKPKGFLKVRSVLQLQNVPSECILIPDEPSSSNEDDSGKQTETRTETENENTVKKPETENVDEKSNGENSSLLEILISDMLTNKKDATKEQTSTTTQPESNIINFNLFTYNVNDPPTKEVKRMKSVYVNVERSPLIK